MTVRLLGTAWALAFLAACSAGPSGGNSDAGVPTWHENVQPIVRQRCQGCHTAGGIAPFSLDTYEDAKPYHAAMAAAVGARVMPPWLPSDDCQSFEGSRRLEASEIALITAWSEADAPEGDPDKAPLVTGDSTATLEWTDATLTATTAYTPNAMVNDDYRCFILDPGLSQTKDIIGFDITPGVRRMVHHVLLYAASPADAQLQDDSEAGQGWTCYGGPGTPNPQLVGGWVPGTGIVKYPETTGIRLEAGKVLVMQIHYNLQNGGAAPDLTTVKLQYAQTPVSKPATILPVAQLGLSIPPNAVGYSESVSSPGLPYNTRLWGVIPHMHVKGKKLRVELGNTCLIDIPQWDFHWQQFFFYTAPISVPANTGTTLTCTWDNPTNSVVTWGEGTEDEMCLNYFYLTL